jgi:hypothetical protein
LLKLFYELVEHCPGLLFKVASERRRGNILGAIPFVAFEDANEGHYLLDVVTAALERSRVSALH